MKTAEERLKTKSGDFLRALALQVPTDVYLDVGQRMMHILDVHANAAHAAGRWEAFEEAAALVCPHCADDLPVMKHVCGDIVHVSGDPCQAYEFQGRAFAAEDALTADEGE